MKKFLNAAILATVILTLAYAIIAFGAVTLELAAPMFLGGILLAVLWASKLLTSERVSWVRSPIHLPMVLFLTYAFLRYLSSPIERDSRVELFHIGLYVLVYFVVACNLYHRRDLTLIFLALMVLAVGEAGYGLCQYATKSNAVLFAERPIGYLGRASGTFVNPNHLAGFLAIVLGLLLARILLHRPAVKATFGAYAGPKIVEGYAALVTVAGIVASGSRGSWLAVIVTMLAFILWAWFPGAVSKVVVGILAGFVAVALVVILSVPIVQQRIKESIEIPKEGIGLTVKDASFNQRTLLWSASTRIIGDHPLFGSGPGTWDWFQAKYRDPKMQYDPAFAHSDLLELTSDYGLIGLGLVAFVLVCYFRQVAHLSSFANFSDQRAFAVGSAFAVAAVLVHSTADFHFHIPATALTITILMALGVAMERGEGSSRRVQMDRRRQISLAIGLLLLAGIGGWFGTKLYWSQHYLRVADSLKEYQDYDEAMPKYQAAIRWDSRNYAAYRGVGDIYVGLGETASGSDTRNVRADLTRLALDSYEKAAALNRYDAQTCVGMADAKALVGDILGAAAMFQRALVLDPNSASILTRLGLFYRSVGEDAKAVEAFQKSLTMKWQEIAYVNLQALLQKKPPAN